MPGTDESDKSGAGSTPDQDRYWMDHPRSVRYGPRKLPPKRPKRLNQRRAQAMRDWLGDLAANEILSHRGPARPIGLVVEEVVGKYIQTPDLLLDRIQRDWSKAVGPVVARESIPVRLEAHVLWIEVSNQAWRYNLEHLMKHEVLASVRRLVGPDEVRDLRFVPAGRRRPRRPGAGGYRGRP